MTARALSMCAILLTTGCQQADQVSQQKTEKMSHQALSDAGPCADTTSNLEYSECWQDRAKQARMEADAAFSRTSKIADNSDLQASYGGEERHWLGSTLQVSQELWAKSVDQQCQFEGRIARGGTGTRALVAKCQDRLSRQRVQELTAAGKLIESNS